jgi:hypothetical protein
VVKATANKHLKALVSFHKTENATWRDLSERLSAIGVDVVVTVSGPEDGVAEFPNDYSRLPNFTIPDVWHRVPITEQGAMAYSEFESSEHFGPLRLIMLTMQNRRDFTGTYRMLERDVRNMSEYFGQFAPELKYTKYAKEMWALYEEIGRAHV